MAAYQRLTLATLLARLQSRASDGGVFWLSTEQNSALNEGLCVYQAMTGGFSTEFDIPVVSGNFYDVPRQIMSLQRVSWNGTVELTLSSIHELDYGFPGWENSTSHTPVHWAPVGFNKFAIYPAPEDGFIHCEGMAEAPLLFASSDYIDIGDEEITRILSYGTHVGAFKEGTVELEASQGALNNLARAAADMNARLKATNFFKKALGLDKNETEEPRSKAPNLGGRT